MVDIVSIMYPFTAGVFVLLSPCGYALIPGYISYHLGAEVSFIRALQGGVVSTLGLVAVFSILGIASSLISGLIRPYLTLFTVFSAVVVIILGILILSGFNFPSTFLKIGGSSKRGMTGCFVFGIAYGFGAAGCTAPIFFSIILFAVANAGVFGGLLTFTLYALGVGLPLIVTSILVATAKRSLISKISGFTPRLNKFSGMVLILVGLYLIYTYITSGLVT
jgi:cytochrome c biogenesis protein CcdA